VGSINKEKVRREVKERLKIRKKSFLLSTISS
jgi:hypothetical protein